jgi:probable FeS assembly SUF system protein SufT
MRVEESLELGRDVLAVAVPAGHRVVLPRGANVDIVQSLGGSFTIKARGNLYRIDGKDADALGKEPVATPDAPTDASDQDVENMVWDQLRTCYDPEIPINIVDLGLVYKCEVERLASGARGVDIEMTLTAPGCGMGDILAADVQQRIMEVPGIEQVKVDLVFDPPWNASMMSEEARLQTGMF